MATRSAAAVAERETETTLPKTMKAVRIHGYGGPDMLRYEDAPCPRPAAGEIVVRVHAAGVNPVDWKVREGYLKDFMPRTFPMIPGWDFSGVVAATGPGASRLHEGDEVYSRPDLARDGTYAEYIAVKETEVGAEAQVARSHARGRRSAGLPDGLASPVRRGQHRPRPAGADPCGRRRRRHLRRPVGQVERGLRHRHGLAAEPRLRAGARRRRSDRLYDHPLRGRGP